MARASGFVSGVVNTAPNKTRRPRTTEQVVEEGEANTRLDRWLKRQVNGVPQALIQKLLRRGQIRVNGQKVSASHRLVTDDRVSWPDAMTSTPVKTSIKMRAKNAVVSSAELEELQKQILHEDKAIIAINKPPGLAVQGGSKQKRSLDALVSALLAARDDTDKLQPRLLHRLDRRTGGIVLFAKSAQAAAQGMEQFRNRTIKKEYWAIVAGIPSDESGTINQPLAKRGSIGGQKVQVGASRHAKEAITHWQLRATQNFRAEGSTKDNAEAGAISWLTLFPETGRMHQLRVHLAHIGTPILGDGKYGGREAFRALPALGLPHSGNTVPLLLLAHKIAFVSPDTGRELTLEAPPFATFTQALQQLQG